MAFFPLTFRVLAAILGLLVVKASACEVMLCLGKGIEMHREFVVRIEHEKKPLGGVSVKVTNNTSGMPLVFSGVTGSDGTLRVTNLSPGDYWLRAEHLGIDAADHCFHVSKWASWKAKHTAVYSWGNYAKATRNVAGKLRDPQLGADVLIGAARLTLRNALTGESYATTSDGSGLFAFGQVSSGTYVLHIEGGANGRSYDATDLLINVDPSANSSTLELARTESDCGKPLQLR